MWGFKSGPLRLVIFNNDHKLDIAITSLTGSHSQPSAITIGLGNGNGTFGAATVFPSASMFLIGLLVGDVNGDHNLDLVMFSERWYLRSVSRQGRRYFSDLVGRAWGLW